MRSLETDRPEAVVGQPKASVGRPAGAVTLRTLARWATSLPALFVLFVTVTILATGPLQRVDVALYQPWSEWILPTWRPFFQNVIDRIAGQAVALPIMSVVALVLAWRRRSWRPVIAGTAAEFGFLGIIGVLKLAFARPAPILQESAFFYGPGLFGDGWHGISYPSGHAAEAVLLYGTAVLLIARYSTAPRWAVGWLCVGVGAITVMAAATSFYLGWHWMTDLVGGVIGGAFVLRLVALLDEMLPKWVPRLVERTPITQWIPYGSEIRDPERPKL